MMNLFGLDREALEREVEARGLAPYRGRQIYRWLYARGADSLDAMTDLPRGARDELARSCRIRHPETVGRHESRDGTVKYQLALEDGRRVEAVTIPEPSRHTICLSTQVGCPLRCTFCFSGTIRFERNLTVGEILGQFLLARRPLSGASGRTNIVFMGMGEPLLNSEAVLGALAILTDPDAFAVSPRRITVSTAGLVSELERFAEKAPAVGLAVSLHATTNDDRSRLMPINRRHPLEELLAAARRLPLPKRRRITFEYVLLGGENDTERDARRLASLLRGMKAKVNLIAFNPWPGAPHRGSTPSATHRFTEILAGSGLTVSLRKSRGDDVLAACGQLANHRTVAATSSLL